jgi:hypothetical protein
MAHEDIATVVPTTIHTGTNSRTCNAMHFFLTCVDHSVGFFCSALERLAVFKPPFPRLVSVNIL